MKNFCGIEIEKANLADAEILLQSIPYDGTSTWGKGADRGFDAFLDALENMEVYDIETDSEVYQRGVYILESLGPYRSPEEMVEDVYETAEQLIALDRFPTFFGGEHSISIGIIRAMRERYDWLSVLQIDAHADLRPSYMGTPFNHACALHESSQHDNLVQVCIRSAEKEEMQFAQDENVFFAHQMYGNEEWMQASIDRLGKEVYLTIDLDALDPSILPGTGTPEPGGLQWYELLKYLRLLFEQREVVGFDIVELAPISGHRASEFLAAKLYYKLLSYRYEL